MKKILICLLVLLIIGCVPEKQTGFEKLESIEEPEDINNVGKYIEEGTKFVKEIIADEYKLSPNKFLTLDGKRVELVDITPDYELIMKINGKEYIIYETNKQEIIDNIEIMATKIKFDPTGKNTYAIFKVKKYEPGLNEYLMHINDKIYLKGHTIILLDVDTDKLQSINLRVDNIDKRINKGKTEIIYDLKITNIETNPRAITSEKYAIIKIIPLT